MRTRFRPFAVAGGLLLAASPALAGTAVGDPLAGLQAMRELNAIVLGDAQGWLTVEGKTFIAGDLKNGGTFGGGNAAKGAAASGYATLTVGGNVTGNIVDLRNGPNGGSGQVGSPATLLVGGTLGGANINTTGARVQVGGTLRNTNGSAGTVVEAGGSGQGYLHANGGSISTNRGAAFAEALNQGISAQAGALEADLKALSSELAGMGTTAGNSISNSFGHLTFTAVDDGTGKSVFNLTEAAFSAWRFTLAPVDPALTIVFNITGDGRYNWNTTLAGAFAGSAQNVIWNFADAERLDTTQTIHGSILAPWAQLGAQSAVNGTVVADDLRANSGVKLGSYAGGDLGLGGADVVPEPATWAMMIAGFGLVGASLRRRRGQVAVALS